MADDSPIDGHGEKLCLHEKNRYVTNVSIFIFLKTFKKYYHIT